jgi:hypothetical protein
MSMEGNEEDFDRKAEVTDYVLGYAAGRISADKIVAILIERDDPLLKEAVVDETEKVIRDWAAYVHEQNQARGESMPLDHNLEQKDRSMERLNELLEKLRRIII